MKVLLVWPNKDQFGFKPISLSLLSSILKSIGHEVELFDTTFINMDFKGNTEVRSKLKIFKSVDFSQYDIKKKDVNLEDVLLKKLNEFKPDVIGISALSDEIYAGFEISKIVKKWNNQTVVIWGNKAATMAPEKILDCPDIDYIGIGEGIEFLPEFVECISCKCDPKSIDNIAYRNSDGSVVKNRLRPYYQDLGRLPYLDWSIFDNRQFLKPFDGKIYRGGDHMIYWGCPSKCAYCINESYRKLYGSNAGKYLRRYCVDRIVLELEYLVKKWNIELFKFHDEDFCLKPLSYFSELATQYLKRVNVPFTIMVNARNVNKEKVELLKQMNCVSVTIGIETGDSHLRKNILKRNESKDDIIEATILFNNAGIRTSSFNMLAIPFENRQTIMKTIELNRKAKVQYPNVGFFFPLDNTELKEIAIREGFYAEDANLMFRNDKPALKFKDISSQELVALMEFFVLYIKMPKDFYMYLEAAEKNSDKGEKLKIELYKIFDECVFANDGKWQDNGKLDLYLSTLKSIYSS